MRVSKPINSHYKIRGKVTCGVFVIREKPKKSFLLLLNRPGKNNKYDIPKGRMDSGEDEKTCALRELFEETGITADNLELDMGFRYTEIDKDTEKTRVIFLGWLKQKVKIKLTEHRGYQWIDWNPPHTIQEGTIDLLLSHLEDFI